MQSLLKSRKFWLAVFAIVQTLVSHYLSIPADVWQAIDALVVSVIIGIAVEDAGGKSGTEVHIHDSVNPETPDPELAQK